MRYKKKTKEKRTELCDENVMRNNIQRENKILKGQIVGGVKCSSTSINKTND